MNDLFVRAPRTPARNLARGLVIAVLALALSAAPASAQCSAVPTTQVSSTTTVTAQLCMRIQDVLVLSVTNTLSAPGVLTSTQFSSAGTPAASATYVPYGGKVALAVSANRNFAVTVSGAFTGPGTKAATDALWSTTQNVFTNTARNVSAANAEANRTITFSGSQPANAAWTQDVFFASRWTYETDRSGAYNLTLTFTLAAK